MTTGEEITPCTIDALLHRHTAFWQRTEVNRPLTGRLPVKRWSATPYPLAGGRQAIDPQRVTPQDLDADLLVGAGTPMPPLALGDLLQTVGYLYPQACLEAIIGCPVFVSAYGCVARPAVESVDEALTRFDVAEALRSPWLPLFDAVMLAARQRAGDGYPVCHPHFRGVVDLLAAYLGEETLCLALCDAPEKVETLAERITAVFRAVAARYLPQCGDWHGGRVSAWQVFAPGPLLDYQIDASSLLSPAVYARHLLPFDRAILAEYPYAVLHLHACGLQMVELLLHCPEVKAVEISADRETGSWEASAFTDTCRRVQQHGKPLIVFSEFSDEEYDAFVESLDPRGLAIHSWRSVG